MTTVSVIPSSDAFVRQGNPTKNYAGITYGKVGVPSSDTHYTFFYFNRPFPLGATIASATLNLHQRGAATGGTRTLTVARVAAAYSESKLTYSNRPGVTGSTATQAQGNSSTDGRLWSFDVTAMMQTVSDGAPWYGFRVAADLTTLLYLYARESAIFQPTLDITWSEAPDAPTVLAPSNDRAVSIARPTLRFDFTDVAGDTSMSGYRLLMNENVADEVSPDYDSGDVSSNIPEHLVTFDITAAENWFWAVETIDGAGLRSGLSEWMSFTRTAKPTLTITNPAASPNDFVTESTPPISWTATGQVAYQVFITDPVDTTEVLWTSGKVTSTDNSISLPDLSTPILSPGGTYSVTVRVWDGVARESTPGDPVYVEASRVFTFDLDNTVTPVSAFTVTAGTPRHTAILGWTRATAPDSFAIIRDGVTIAQDLVPADLLVSGTTYAYIDTTATPRRGGHTWSVLAVVGGLSSDANPTDTAILEPTGIWLSSLDGSHEVCITGGDLRDVEGSEESSVHYPLGATNPVLITQAIHGRVGKVSGYLRELPDLPGIDVDEWRAEFLVLRTPPGQTLSLVANDTVMKVFIFNAVVGVAEEFTDAVPISFEFCELL